MFAKSVAGRLAIAVALAAMFVTIAGCGDDSDDDGATAMTSEPATPTARSEPQEVSIGAGTALVWGNGTYGVVLVHGAIYDAASWTAQAEAIAASGFAVVAVENATADDTRAAADFLRRTFGATHVALVGASAGTGPVLSVAADASAGSQPVVDLVVILAGSGNVDELDVPSVLFISAEGDGAASAAERMLEATSGDPADLLLVSGSAHAQALFNEPEGEQVLQAILSRLADRQAVTTSEP